MTNAAKQLIDSFEALAVQEQQEVLVLRFVENMSSRQVANMLGKNEGAIRALQFRALGRLRKLMTSEVA